MEEAWLPAHWIAVASVIATAAVAIANAWLNQRNETERRTHELDMQEAVFAEQRAAEVRKEGIERFLTLVDSASTLSPEIPYPWYMRESAEDLRSAFLEALNAAAATRTEIDWLRLSGWRPEIRDVGDRLQEILTKLTDPLSTVAVEMVKSGEAPEYVPSDEVMASWREFRAALGEMRDALRG